MLNDITNDIPDEENDEVSECEDDVAVESEEEDVTASIISAMRMVILLIFNRFLIYELKVFIQIRDVGSIQSLVKAKKG